ncbi:MAG: hypothetical protein AAGC68_01785, partial [Verrucomicrobiota bacterium]
PETWERYFDHYLDGKKVPVSEEKKEPDGIDGWIARNALLKRGDGHIRVVDPDEKQRHRPFIANNKIAIEGPGMLRIEFGERSEGPVALQWREKDQEDFVGDSIPFEPVADSQGVLEVPISSARSIIHFRLRFPDGETEIRRITVRDDAGGILEDWDFSEVSRSETP